MAQINFNELNNNTKSTKTGPGYFSLKNDKDEAIVRILANSVDDFDIVTCHDVVVDGRNRLVNCVKGPYDASEKCPFCEAGENLRQVFFIHLIQYESDDKGNIIPVAKVWQRSTYYATIIRDLISEYGPLSEIVLKIRRNGVAGSKDTNYTIIPANPAIYKNENYPFVDLFGDYKVVGRMVMNKSVNDMRFYIDNGYFPDVNAQATPKSENDAVNNKNNETIDTSYNAYESYQKVEARPRTVDQVPWGSNTVTPPRRY